MSGDFHIESSTKIRLWNQYKFAEINPIYVKTFSKVPWFPQQGNSYGWHQKKYKLILLNWTNNNNYRSDGSSTDGIIH